MVNILDQHQRDLQECKKELLTLEDQLDKTEKEKKYWEDQVINHDYHIKTNKDWFYKLDNDHVIEYEKLNEECLLLESNIIRLVSLYRRTRRDDHELKLENSRMQYDIVKCKMNVETVKQRQKKFEDELRQFDEKLEECHKKVKNIKLSHDNAVLL